MLHSLSFYIILFFFLRSDYFLIRGSFPPLILHPLFYLLPFCAAFLILFSYFLIFIKIVIFYCYFLTAKK